MFASAEKGRQGDGFITKAPIVGFGISQLSTHTYFPANNFIYDSEEFIYQKTMCLYVYRCRQLGTFVKIIFISMRM